MKRRVLIVPFIILTIGASSLCADQIPIRQPKITVVTQIRSINDINKKIQEAQEYLERLPKQLDETKKKFMQLTSQGNKIEEDISFYLKYMDICSTNELKHKGRDMCDSIINASIHGKGFQDILNEKRTQIEDAIEFINSQIKTIKDEMKETASTRAGIEVLERMKNILLFNEEK